MKKGFYLLFLSFFLCAVVAKAVPVITTNLPASTLVCSGTSVQYVAYLNDTPTSVTWQVSTNGGTTWTDITTGGPYTFNGLDTLNIATDYTLNNNLYRFMAADSVSVTSHNALLTVDTTVAPLAITGPDKTCVGGSIHLMNANVNGTFTWAASNGVANVSASGYVTGISAGVDTISYTFTNTCNTVTSTDTVTVETPADHGVISGPATVCNGSLITLSETVTGGIWISGNSATAVIDEDGNVTGVAQGAVTISYYLSNACGASVATYAVTVEDGAATITGGDSVGVGSIIALSNATPGGTWSSSNHAKATVNASGIVTGIAVGVDSIIYTVTNTCGTSSSILTLHVGSAPSAGTIYGPDSVCIGAHITLADTLVGNGVWSIKNAHATITAAGVVTGVTYGKDTAYYSYTNAFGTTKVSKTVFVNAPPADSISYPESVGLGLNYTLLGYPAGGVWTVTNHTVATIIGSNILVILTGGKDTAIYTTTNTCGVDRDSFVVNAPIIDNVTSVSTNGSKLSLYPNPAHGDITFNLQSAADEVVNVVITNVVGEKVKTLTLTTNTAEHIILNQAAGVYLLTATTASGTYNATINIIK